MTATKAIRAKCLDCCCGSSAEVKLCPCSDCPLYPFRLGKNPNYKAKELSEEEKAKRVERLMKGWISIEKAKVKPEETETTPDD